MKSPPFNKHQDIKRFPFKIRAAFLAPILPRVLKEGSSQFDRLPRYLVVIFGGILVYLRMCRRSYNRFFRPKICLNLNEEMGMMSNEKKDVVVLCAFKEAGAENLSGRENRYCYD